MTEPLSLAKYPYVHGNPVNSTDPSGMFTIGEVAIDNTRVSLERAYEASSAIRPAGTVSKIALRLIVYSVLVAATLYTLDYLLNGSEQDNDSYGIPKVVWGEDLPESTTHTIEALSGAAGKGFKGGLGGFGSPVLLRIAFPMRNHRRNWRAVFSDWHDKEPQCRNKTGRPIGLSCDEYPYNSTIPGGLAAYNLNLVSLKPVSATEQNTQGGWLNSFYTKAGVIPWHPQEGWFAVGASLKEDKSYWIARGETEKNYFK